jgi:hypothetical protein
MQLRFLLLLLPLFLTTPLFASSNFCIEQQNPKPIFCQDFEHRDTGLYTSDKLIEDWPNLQSLSTKVYVSNFGVSQQRVTIVAKETAKETEKTRPQHNRMLKIKYPENLFGSAHSGATWVMKFPKKYQQLSLEYKVMFEQGFLYNREGLFGGKLPGLMGGETISGGATADGTNGWTSRIMWGQMGRGLGYLYYPDMRDVKYNQKACPRFGLESEDCVIFRNKYFTFDNDSSKKCLSEWAADDYEFRFETGRSYKIKQLIKMNTLSNDTAEGSDNTAEDSNDTAEGSDNSAEGSNNNAEGSEKSTDEVAQGNRDGQLKIWLDDKLVVDCTNIRFRDVPELAIDSLLFSTFFGGNTAESSSHPHDETIYFDDFVVREN